MEQTEDARRLAEREGTGMKLVAWPAVEADRWEKITAVADGMACVNAASEAEAAREIVDADAFFGKLTPGLLAAAGRLAWVQSPTASLEHYLFPELLEHPCVLTNMRGLFADNIADHVFGVLLCFVRKLHLYVRRQMERRWAPVGGEQTRVGFATGPALVTPMDLAHPTLAGATLGIVGLGSIGAEIARRAPVFGMTVLAVDPKQTVPPEGVASAWPLARLDELLAASDHVVIAAPHTPETVKLFNAARLAVMKPTAYLVNIGRGAIVDLTDLTAALSAGQLAGAGLDVFETEPLPADHPLWGMENVIITPHVAGASPRIAERHLAVLLENVSRFRRGEPLQNICDKRAWF